MSKRIRGCTGKVRHASKEGACIAARRSKNVQMNVYLCPSCKGWHIGRSNDPLRKIARIDQLLRRHERETERRNRHGEMG